MKKFIKNYNQKYKKISIKEFRKKKNKNPLKDAEKNIEIIKS